MAQAAATVLRSTSDVVDIPLTLIVADPKKNTRSFLPMVEELATSIKSEGQQSAVTVSKRTDGKFDLVWGYRRYAAITLLHTNAKSDKERERWSTIRCVVNEEMTPKERLLANLIENFAREDLSSYDAASAFADLRDLMTEETDRDPDRMGATIAKHVAKSSPYVNNLLRAWDNLPAVIKERWRKENAPDWKEIGKGARAVLTTDTLNKLAKDSLTEEERMDLYNQIIGVKKAGKEGDDEDDSREPRTPNPLSKRPGKKDLEAALAAAEEVKGKAGKEKGQDQKVEKLNGVIQALKFALGTNQTIPGVYNPPEDDEDEEN